MGTYMKNLDSESLNFVLLWNLQIKLNPLESIIAVVITKLIVNSTHSNWSRVGRKQENAIKKLASDPDDWKTGWQSIAPLQLALLVWRAIHACKKTSNTCKLSFFRNHISLAGVILHLFMTRSTMRTVVGWTFLHTAASLVRKIAKFLQSDNAKAMYQLSQVCWVQNLPL